MSGSGSLKLAPSLAQHLNRLGYVNATDVSANERLNDDPIHCAPEQPSTEMAAPFEDRDHFLVVTVEAIVIEFDHHPHAVRHCPVPQDDEVE